MMIIIIIIIIDDEAVRVGVGLQLVLPILVPHKCHCSSSVDVQGLHSFVCKRASGRAARHHLLNDLVARAMVSDGIPVTKEPGGLSRSDGKRPDGFSLVPWEAGQPFVVCPLADSYVAGAAREARSAAEAAAARNSEAGEIHTVGDESHLSANRHRVSGTD